MKALYALANSSFVRPESPERKNIEPHQKSFFLSRFLFFPFLILLFFVKIWVLGVNLQDGLK